MEHEDCRLDEGSVRPAGRIPDHPLFTVAPEEAVFMAMGAYDNLGRRIVMANRGDFTKSQADALVGLMLYGSMSMTQISEHLAVSKEQATRTIAPLVERGLVQRARNPRNLRVVDITLTAEGERLISESQKALIETLCAKLAELSPEDRATLIEASRTAERILRKLTR